MNITTLYIRMFYCLPKSYSLSDIDDLMPVISGTPHDLRSPIPRRTLHVIEATGNLYRFMATQGLISGRVSATYLARRSTLHPENEKTRSKALILEVHDHASLNFLGSISSDQIPEAGLGSPERDTFQGAGSNSLFLFTGVDFFESLKDPDLSTRH